MLFVFFVQNKIINQLRIRRDQLYEGTKIVSRTARWLLKAIRIECSQIQV